MIFYLLFCVSRTENVCNKQKRKKERKETSQSKTEWTKIYNAQNIVETEQLVEMLKQSEMKAFSQEAGANVSSLSMALLQRIIPSQSSVFLRIIPIY